MAGLLERLKQHLPDLAASRLAPETEARLERFEMACPLYARLLAQHPDWLAWLESPETLSRPLTVPILVRNWGQMLESEGLAGRQAVGYLPLLRRFRRKTSMRIAYRDVGGLASIETTTADLTLLADFCVRECLAVVTERLTRRLGSPVDSNHDRPARFVVLALGKLGGRELNFSSDIDLIFVFDGEGHTRRPDGRPGVDNHEYYQRLGEALMRELNRRDGEGFLFRTDLRLRPGGNAAPLVPSMEAVENYYAVMGQTWERLALIKARPVAGDLALGDELLESLHAFRYPRHPPPSLLADVAAMKLRTEREIVGRDVLARDVKSGYGGIREIEFFVQAWQLMRAGRFPFLQTGSTTEALRQLARYGQIPRADAAFLEDAYWFLRSVEHRIQMAEEQQSHELPADDAARANIATSLGFPSLEAFDERLATVRDGVRQRYHALFHDSVPAAAEIISPWWAFFAHGTLTGPVPEKLREWFGDDPAAAHDLRLLVRGSENTPLTRDQVQRFIDLIPAIDRAAPRLATPIRTFRRIAQFAGAYGSRVQFFAACAANPRFLEAVALLFDRSEFIFDLLRQHPEIFDEVLRPEILRKRKDLPQRIRELEAHTGEDEAAFAHWLWLYVRAEQVRAAIGQLLDFLTDEEVERDLSLLAEAVLIDLTRRIPDAADLGIVALGKLGGHELAYGSDLDVLFVGSDAEAAAHTRAIRHLARLLAGDATRPPTFELDTRLRPYGEAGSPAPSIAGLRRYFARSAQLWERQALTRERFLRGPDSLREAWQQFVDDIVYAPSLTAEQATALWAMRLRVQRERDRVNPPERAFKTGAGGLIDIEFALQILQLRHGGAHPEIRSANTADGWRRLEQAGIAPTDLANRILDHLRFLKRIELRLRREKNRGVSVLPGDPEKQRILVAWLGGTSWEAFWSEHCERMRQTRADVARILTGLVASTALETHR